MIAPLFNRVGATATNTGEISFDTTRKVLFKITGAVDIFYWRIASKTNTATYQVQGLKTGKAPTIIGTYTPTFNPAGTTYFVDNGFFAVSKPTVYDLGIQFVALSGSFSIHGLKENVRV
jgi:hypothetical protein